MLEDGELRDAPSRFVDFANNRGGQDNITVVTVTAEATGRANAANREREDAVVQRLGALRRMPAFAGVKVPNLLRLANAMDLIEVEAGEDPVAQAWGSPAYYMVLSGHLKNKGSASKDCSFGSGDCFGFETLDREDAEPFEYQATEHSLVAMIPWKDIDRLARRSPRLGYRIFRKLVCDLVGKRKA